MKKIFLLISISGLLPFSISLFAQTNLQIGASGVFSKTKGKGVEIIGNLKVTRAFSIGLGTQPIKFEEHNKWYVPVFGSFKYYYSLKKSMLFANVDPGYGIYPVENFSDGTYSYYRKGTIYLSAAVGIAGKSSLAPYASFHFTKFGFREYNGASEQYRPISTFTFSAGIMLNHSVPDKMAFQKKEKQQVLTKPVIVLTADEYLAMSERQRKTGRILLITGGALIGGALIIFSKEKHKDDITPATIPMVLMGLSGATSSLISIPFLLASNHNEKKATKMRSTGF